MLWDAFLFIMVLKSGYLTYCSLSISSNQSGLSHQGVPLHHFSLLEPVICTSSISILYVNYINSRYSDPSDLAVQVSVLVSLSVSECLDDRGDNTELISRRVLRRGTGKSPTVRVHTSSHTSQHWTLTHHQSPYSDM